MSFTDTKVQEESLTTREQEDLINCWRNFKPYNPENYTWDEPSFENIPHSEIVDTDTLHLLLTPDNKLTYDFVSNTLKDDPTTLIALMTILNTRFKDKEEYDIKESLTFTPNEETLMFSGLKLLRGYNERYMFNNPYIGQIVAESRKIATRYNIGLVVDTINRKYKPRSLREREEFFSAGVQRLIRSIDLYDPEKGYRFSTYAVRAIVTTLIRERGEDKIIRLPYYIDRQLRNYREIANRLRQEFNTEPTTEQIISCAQENDIDIPKKELIDHLLLGDAVSLDNGPSDTESRDEGEDGYYDFIPEPTDYNREVQGHLIRKGLIKIIDDTLPERSATMMKMYYGFIKSQDPSKETCSMAEIGKEFDLTGERVRQLLNEARNELRNHPQIRAMYFNS